MTQHVAGFFLHFNQRNKAVDFCIYETEKVFFFPYLFWKPVNGRFASWLDRLYQLSTTNASHFSYEFQKT